MRNTENTALAIPSSARASTRFPEDAPTDRPEAYVYPGQLLSAPAPLVATTILGTCVSVCLFDPSSGIGGLNHFMLPHSPRSGPPSARFGDVATQQLVDALLAHGAAPRRLQAKVFGGMEGRMGAEGLAKDLGARNIAVAVESLRGLGIPVVAEDVGGPKSRKLVFHTSDGRAWVRHF
jgi:chemotaxis protein CheD